ncbi:YfhO family protein [Carnobacterium alterfunditum]|uniref:YfhO family protein n=1 Tax=Carnobacterium alterfunditum TaxID=28230 RepID=UPI003593929C
MQKTMQTFIQKQWPLLLAFFVPFLTLSTIYIFQGVYPFGNDSLLTVDLGQQYIDFFAYYRQTFFEDPSTFFYSFSKAIGGDMLGLWAYYLTSPFNLLFLLFPHTQITLAVTCLTLLKISLSGLSFGYLLKKAFNGTGFILAAFSISYALMGYTIVNQLNIMWLDGLIFLPLIVLGLERLIDKKAGLLYSIFLGIMLFANYYIAYMICLFLICYFIFRLVSVSYPKEMPWKMKFKETLVSIGLFIWHSVLGAGLAGILLLPTFQALMESKASYTKFEFDWELAYPFSEMLSKLFIGAFNFEQMPSGYPNLFIGSLALVSFLCYFFNQSFSKRERLAALAVMILFVVSLNLEAFNKIWHAMQYPIWYPYRFSFVVCFFMLVNGFRSFMHYEGMRPISTFVSMVLTALVSFYVYNGEFDFIYTEQIILTILFTFMVIFLLIIKPQKYTWLPVVFFILTTIEMGLNAQIDLSRLSYVDQDNFTVYQTELDANIDAVQDMDSTFYRIEKTFLRTKNDSFQANYPSITHFSSTFERTIPALFGSLGFPVGDGFLAYSNGTLLTDALFNIQYYMSEKDAPYLVENNNSLETKNARLKKTLAYAVKPSLLIDSLVTPTVSDEKKAAFELSIMQTKPDLRSYKQIGETDRIFIYENQNALPLAFGSSSAILDVSLLEDQPIQLQETILHSLTGNQLAADYFVPSEFDSTVYQNVTLSDALNETTYQKQVLNNDASVSFQFTPDTNDSFYLTLSPNIKDEDVELFLNGEPFTQYKTYRDQLILNLASQNKGDTITFKISLKESTIRLKDFQLYRLDSIGFDQAIQSLKTGGMTIEEYGNTSFKGTVNIQKGQDILMTTIPYSEGWAVKIDGVPVQTKQALESLLVVPIDEGKHVIELDYTAPLFFEGTILTLLSAALLLLTALLFEKTIKGGHL